MGRQKLYESDPGNRTWQTGLMTDYRLLGDVLVQKEEWGGALQNYNAAIRNRANDHSKGSLETPDCKKPSPCSMSNAPTHWSTGAMKC